MTAEKHSTASSSSSLSPEVIAAHGLTNDEYDRIVTMLGRTPNLLELGIFSVMWSEHCSYKTTRIHLKKLPTEAPWVICGPGENAGIIDIGDQDAIVFKMESHNHPSFIEPYQGAATGVGGIMRDVFTMGARPICNLNALRFGEITHPKTKHLVSGVVAGIGGYGNCMGIPTVAGECNFHPAYNGNILVNAMCVGLAKQDKLFYSAASAVGSPVMYVGAKTGRDGIHGATMASAEFDDASESKRPTVQVGDPFTEKRLLEACLELMATDAILSIQDMGAAGLTCSSLEMADKGGTGIELELDHVPVRESHMTPYEMMLSESQERMLMVIKPEKQTDAKRIFDKWEVDCARIGTITDTGRLVLRFEGRCVADLPIAPLSQHAPVYERPYTPTLPQKNISYRDLQPPKDITGTLQTLLASPDLASKRWIYEQYDRQVMNDSIGRQGGDAALIRIHGSSKAIAVTTDCTPRYCFADPHEGGKQAVVETWRNICATGATPLAITNCLNFGNPEKPEIMGQIVGCLEGMSEACRSLNYPIISGNVSLYNETNGKGILPTPAIGGVGLLPDVQRAMSIGFKQEGDIVIVIGTTEGHMGQSLYLREIEKREEGLSPRVDLVAEKKYGEWVRALITEKHITACHDVSDGGLAVALAEMAMQGHMGATVTCEFDCPTFAYLFGEDQGRYVITVSPDRLNTIQTLAKKKSIPLRVLGTTGGKTLIFGSETIAVSVLIDAHERTLPRYLDE